MGYTKTKTKIGDRYGRLVVIKRVDNTGDNHKKWLCQCDCGKTKEVSSHSLRAGSTRSCGCLRKQTTILNNKKRKSDTCKTYQENKRIGLDRVNHNLETIKYLELRIENLKDECKHILKSLEIEEKEVFGNE